MFYKPIPSTDLYFLNSCRDLTGWGKPVKRIGSNSFRCGNRYLIIRKERSSIAQKIMATPGAKIIMVIDDDIMAAAEDSSLPKKYQKKLEKAVKGVTGLLLRRADLVLAPSNRLIDRLSGCRNTGRIDPYWGKKCPTDEHFNDLQPGKVSLVHLGTASHQAAMDFLAPVLKAVFQAVPDVRFHYFSNSPALGKLDHTAQVIRRPVLSWQKYSRTINQRKFHLALYPIMDTPFNRARSCNKITEHALAGCAGIYSGTWEHGHRIKPGETGWLAENDTDEWIDMILDLVEKPSALETAYQSCRLVASQTVRLEEQRALWKRILLEGDL